MKKSPLNRKLAKKNGPSSKEKILMVNKHMKRCLMSLPVKGKLTPQLEISIYLSDCQKKKKVESLIVLC